MHNFIRKRGFQFNQINKLGIISLLSSISVAFVATIWAIYLESFLHNPSYVGFLSTFFTIVAGLSYIFLIPIVEKNSKTKLFSIALTIYFISYIFFCSFIFILLNQLQVQ